MNHNQLVSEITAIAHGVDAAEAASVLKALGEVLRQKTTEEAIAIIEHIVREK